MDRRTKLIVAALAAVAFLVHLRIAPGFTWFRDEMYFLACADHLAWGYPDHPAGTVLIAWLARKLFGDSLLGLRLFPAAANAAIVLATAELARALGGRRYAISLAAMGALIAPVYMGLGGALTTNVFEPVLWTVMVTLVVRMVRGEAQSLWLWFGLLAGIALEFKPTMLALAGSLIAGLLLTRNLDHFRSRWIWLGGAIAGLFFLPYVVWNAQHGWVTLELLRVANDAARTAMGLKDFTFTLFEMANPITAILWVGGLIWLLSYPAARPFRFLGAAFVVLFVMMAAMHAKPYYMAAALAPMLAAGAVAREQHIEENPRHRAWTKPVTLAVFAICGALVAPLPLPLLTPPASVAYVPAPLREQIYDAAHGPRGLLWVPLAEQTGWPDLAARVGDAWHTLTPDEQRRAGIYASSYGQAAAIELFGGRYGLPRPVSGHNSYFLWGPGDAARADVLILVGERREFIARDCASVTTAAKYENLYGRPFDNGPILVCRGLRRPLAELWPQLKLWGQD